MGTAKKATEQELTKFETNYASRPDVARRFMESVADTLTHTRHNRLSLEEQWIEDMRLWSCRLDGQGYVGRSNIFVAELHNQVESSVEKALTNLFPSPDVINCMPKNGTKLERTQKIENAVRYELEEKNNLFLKMEEHERQKILLGSSVIKGTFKKEMRSVFTRDQKGKPIKSDVPIFYGAKWDVVDIFRWYIYPETSALDSMILCFEDQLMELGAAERSGLYVNLDQVQSIPNDIKHHWADTERLEMAELSNALKARTNTALFRGAMD